MSRNSWDSVLNLESNLYKYGYQQDWQNSADRSVDLPLIFDAGFSNGYAIENELGFMESVLKFYDSKSKRINKRRVSLLEKIPLYNSDTSFDLERIMTIALFFFFFFFFKIFYCRYITFITISESIIKLLFFLQLHSISR